MSPIVWLALWLVAAVVLLILGAVGAYPVGYRRGYAEAMTAAAPHRHRKGGPQETTLLQLPTAGRLPVEPPWHFAGESEAGWAAESAEYELLTQTAEQPASVTGEPPIDTGELLAITDRVEAWIAGWSAQGNYDRHTMRAD